jgi:hypothetical protein
VILETASSPPKIIAPSMPVTEFQDQLLPGLANAQIRIFQFTLNQDSFMSSVSKFGANNGAFGKKLLYRYHLHRGPFS